MTEVALAKRPDGIPEAIEIWSDLEAESPPGTTWLDALKRYIRLTKEELAAFLRAWQAAESNAGAAGLETGN